MVFYYSNKTLTKIAGNGIQSNSNKVNPREKYFIKTDAAVAHHLLLSLTVSS